MIAMNREQMEAAIRLMNEKDFISIMKWIIESMNTEAMRAVSIPTDPQRSWMQGRVQQLQSIVEALKGARNNLELLERKGE